MKLLKQGDKPYTVRTTAAGAVVMIPLFLVSTFALVVLLLLSSFSFICTLMIVVFAYTAHVGMNLYLPSRWWGDGFRFDAVPVKAEFPNILQLHAVTITIMCGLLLAGKLLPRYFPSAWTLNTGPGTTVGSPFYS